MPECLTLFGSRHFVVQHLQDRKGCLSAIQAVYTPLPVHVVKQQDATALKAAKLNIPLYPALKCPGPRVSHELAFNGLRVLSSVDIDLACTTV